MKSVTVQLPDDVYKRAERRAGERGGTLSSEIVALVQRFSEEELDAHAGNGTNPTGAASRLEKTLQELAQVAQECLAPGWDGRDAMAIGPQAVRMAHDFLAALPIDLPVPSVGAEPDGHITLEWHRQARRTLSISITAGPQIHYAALLDQRKAFGQELFLGQIPPLILDLIRRVDAS